MGVFMGWFSGFKPSQKLICYCSKGHKCTLYATIQCKPPKWKPFNFFCLCPWFVDPSVGFDSQQDAEEFLIYLLEGLHDDLNRTDKQTRQQYIERGCSDLDHLA